MIKGKKEDNIERKRWRREKKDGRKGGREAESMGGSKLDNP